MKQLIGRLHISWSRRLVAIALIPTASCNEEYIRLIGPLFWRMP